MASEVTRDLVGSTQLNTESSFGAKAERKVFVRIDPTDSFANNTLLGRAIEKAVDGVFTHPDDATLPLKQARARQVGNQTAEVILSYGRSKTSSSGFDVPSGGGIVYQSRASTYLRKVYLLDGKWTDRTATSECSSDAVACNEKKIPVPLVYAAPQETIIVPAVLNDSQFRDIATAKNAVGKRNANVLQFGGQLFPVNSLLLEAVDVDWQSQRFLGGIGPSSSVFYLVKYRFKFRPEDLHVEPFIKFNKSASPPQWELDSTGHEIFGSVNMSGFPL